jgi:hypothetical protein
MMTIAAPERDETSTYYHGYIDQAGEGDVRQTLQKQLGSVVALLQSISDEKSLHRYAPDKWSIREVLSHLNDSERIFTLRALWFARGFDSPLPGFEQDIAIAHAGADQRTWQSHVDEFITIRGATLTLFQYLPEDAWMRRGTASGKPFTVRSLAYIVAGHTNHHLRVVRERYL